MSNFNFYSPDNCPLVHNPGQEDTDPEGGDKQGKK